MEPTLEIFGSQINILGDFNPPVITPAWLKTNDLIGKEDEKFAMECESLVITPDISRFETDWFWIQIVKSQFVLNSKGPVTPAIKDLVTGVFALLGHTPLTAVGLNSLAHYKVYSVDAYHRIGDVLAPKNVWNSFYPESENQNVGLQEMSLLINPWARGQKERTAPHKRISLSASNSIANGIFFTLNDHFPIPIEDKKQTSSESLIEIIDAHWQSSMNEAKHMFLSVINQAISAQGDS